MAVDIGIDFRETFGGATDPANCTYCLGEAYPVTRLGHPLGWYNASVPATILTANRSAVDGRHGGINFTASNVERRFFLGGLNVGLTTFHLANGDTSARGPQIVRILDSDGSTVLHTISTGAIAANTYNDATGTNFSAAAWVTSESGQVVTISGTSIWVQVGVGGDGSDYHAIAHFRVVQADGPPPATIYGRRNRSHRTGSRGAA